MSSSQISRSSAYPWGAEAESLSDPLLSSMARLRSWIDSYVRAQLGPSVCGNDFTERLYQRVNTRIETHRQDKLLPDELDGEVRNNLQLLVHEDQQKSSRRSKIFMPVNDIEAFGDPASVQFAERLEVAAEARAFLESIPEDLIPVIRHLYGLNGEKVKSRKQIAKDLGLKVNTLNQRLRRVYEKLRASRE